MSELTALLAFATALAVALVATPMARAVARGLGVVDQPRARGLAERPTPLLGGLAILAAVVVAAAAFLPLGAETRGILAGAALITLVGTLDDLLELPAGLKLCGQVVAAGIPVASGVSVHNTTIPFLGRLELGHLGPWLTLLGLVAVINAVNLSDGIDGLSAGVGAIAALAFSVIAFDLGTRHAGVLAAVTAGACLGFLLYNFPPASIFMGDGGSNLLGLLLGCVAVQGSLKTNAVIALVLPLVIFAVPFLDTSFVVAKRIKYRRPFYVADAEHFHHRLDRIGFSKRRAVAYLYAWTLALAALGVALRFVPYSDHHGHFDTGWIVVLGVFGALAVATSVYLVVVLEILKFRRVRIVQLRRLEPETAEHELVARVQREVETGEWDAVDPGGGRDGVPVLPPAHQGTGELGAAT